MQKCQRCGFLRLLRRITRRRYHAPHCGYSWHTDCDLKAREVGISITGCVDGFSRRVIWCGPSRAFPHTRLKVNVFLFAISFDVFSYDNRLKVILDMRPITIFPFYLEAVQLHGIPDCLICDKGNENRLMAFAQWLARAEGITEVTTNCMYFTRCLS
jgi:hypothetical protein